MKVRIIPTILTDGFTVVKGEKFNNWRTVGSAEATARLYAVRDVDELMFLDVTARSRSTTLDLSLLRHFTDLLDIPFSVGGGINNIEDAKACFRGGAEKIVLGTSAVEKPNLITEIAETFGSQAVVVSIDFEKVHSDVICVNSGTLRSGINAFDFIQSLEDLGAGELLLQSIERDGSLKGLDCERIKKVSSITNLPIIASSGVNSEENFLQAVLHGASAVAGGSMFQFTESTPRKIRDFLGRNGIPVRKIPTKEWGSC